MSRKAIGVVRVSRVGDREGESFVSPIEQRDRITGACERDGLILAEILEEPNVSGGAPLAQRHGLREAVERVEAGSADVIVVAYFDRLVRSLTVQAEVVARVEAAGGAILAVDIGEVRADTASRWLSSTMLGMVAEYHRRVTGERTQDAKRRAVARGVPPFPNVPPGYQRREDGSLEPSSDAPVIAELFERRAAGETILNLRMFLREYGILRSFHGVQAMLGCRIYIGELNFGAMTNPASHEAIVDAGTFGRVQKMRVSRGRRPKSDRLLARQGVLRCANCNGRMVLGVHTVPAAGKRYQFYRCSTLNDCQKRVSVSADIADAVVVEHAKRLLAGMVGKASQGDETAAAAAEVVRRQEDLDKAIRTFAGLEEESARVMLMELRDGRDAAIERLNEMRAAHPSRLELDAGTDWEHLTLDARRALIRTLISRVIVGAGRGRERLTVEARGQ